MKTILKAFADDEFGNAVIDWTVLMIGALMLAVALVLTFVAPDVEIADGTSASDQSIVQTETDRA